MVGVRAAPASFTVDAKPGCDSVRVVTDGSSTSRVYFTADGSTPTIDGTGVYFLLGAQAGRRTVPVPAWMSGAVTPATVKVLSAGTPWVAVEAVPSGS
jgi:hypothetical protein